MACGYEGATLDCMVKTPMTQRHLHNMNLDVVSLENLQGPIHEIIHLSIDFLIQPSISTFHLSWPNLVTTKKSSSLWLSQY
jgi:hypothetical protein